jgi:hypothetical protein
MSAPVALSPWPKARAELAEQGYAVVPSLLDGDQCASLIAAYDDATLFRKTVVMARHGFGRGEYRYFAAPLPPLIAELRAALYRELQPVANAWWEALANEDRFPASHDDFLARAHAAGQHLPTPLLLRYGPGDYNCLHQDLYGDVWFPLQVAILLDEPEKDFEGGEFVLVEQRPRMQSRPIVVPLRGGQGVVFPCHHRARAREKARAQRAVRTVMRHGVSELRTGRRHTLGVIFHDAKS